MATWRILEQRFLAFEMIQDQIVANSTKTDADWRKTLIGLRRQLQESLVEMRASLQACEKAGADTAICKEFTSSLSAMRNALALHQAQWPAVAIDTKDAAYTRSLQDLRHAATAFREKVRALIEKSGT